MRLIVFEGVMVFIFLLAVLLLLMFVYLQTTNLCQNMSSNLNQEMTYYFGTPLCHKRHMSLSIGYLSDRNGQVGK